MEDNNDRQLPVEIQWKLASTTQPLEPGGPKETTVSLFYHVPDEAQLVGLSPDETLLYLKCTVSISPCSLELDAPNLAANFLAGNLPALHVLLDLTVRPETNGAGGVCPYFHAAAPLHRRIIESGVVGDDFFEGESQQQFIGKSGSHLYENLTSSTGTRSGGGGLSFSIGGFGIGASASASSTNVASSRSVDQVVDTTTREASQERRELVSHLTNVENVITLLNAKFIGTPYLRFSLSPRPMQLLSIDPNDPNLWFSQLLRRRSSGIEGIQEFTAVVVVPKNTSFCIDAKLRRVCLLDDPPIPPNFNEPLEPDFFQLARMVRYLYNVFPKGTPLDELDIDIAGPLSASDFLRPIIKLWAFRLGPQIIEAVVASPGANTGQARITNVNYKHMLELWLETLRSEYEQELARSPLERGIVLGENRILKTCFEFDDGGGIDVSSSSASTTPLVPIEIDFTAPDIATETTIASTRSRAVQTITQWNTLEQKLDAKLSNLKDLPKGPTLLEDSRVVDILLSRWAGMSKNDRRNLSFDEAEKQLGLTRRHSKLLKKSGAKDLKGIALALRAATDIEKQNTEIQKLKAELDADQSQCLTGTVSLVTSDTLDFSISTNTKREILDVIAAAICQNGPKIEKSNKNLKA